MTDNADLATRYSRLTTAFVSDVLRIGGIPHAVVHHSVHRMISKKTIAGRAFCVRGETILGGVPATDRNVRLEMFQRVASGEIVVIESGGYEAGVMFGDNVVEALHVRGCTGIVTDGGIRDRDALDELGMPIFGRFATPLSSGGQWNMTDLQVPIHLKGQTSTQVVVHPGDMILADGDGVVVVPHQHAEQVLEDAEKLAEIEVVRSRGLMSGRDAGEVFGETPLFQHIRPLTTGR